MSGGVWFTSDTHFSHKLVAEIRGCLTADDHDAEIIERWNAKVRPGDVVWHLGDVGMGPLSRFRDQVSELNGTIHLITGNHDEVSPIHRDSHKKQRAWMEAFASVQAYARRRINGQTVLLSHYPYKGDHTKEDRFDQYRLRSNLKWLLHGHVHSGPPAWEIGSNQIHVGLDAWDLAPVGIDQVVKIMNEDPFYGNRGETSERPSGVPEPLH